jgi:predicted permease
VHLNGQSWRINGVAPEGVDFPAGTQLWLSDPPVGEFYGSALGPSVVALLHRGALGAVQSALVQDAEVQRAAAGEAAAYMTDPTLVPLRAYLTSSVRLPLMVLAASAAAVLLLGCVNVAGVSLARVALRAPELATRRALGAGQARVFAQLLVELAVVAAVAGVLSVLLTTAAIPALVSLLPAETAGIDTVRPAGRTMVFSGALTVLAALVAGVPPAIAGAWEGRTTLQPDRLRADDRRGQRFQGALTTVQVALAVMLVAGAALLGRSLVALQAVPLGYDTEGVLSFSVRLPQASYGRWDDVRRYADEVRTRLAALPGVEAVGVADRLPLIEGMGVGGRVRRAGSPPDHVVTARHVAADSGFFRALGIDVLTGRTFTADDADQAVVLSRSLAAALFGDDPAQGARVTVRRPGTELDATVVGVVADVRDKGAESEVHPTVYLPLVTTFVSSPSFVIRTSGSPAAFTAGVRRVLAEVDATVAPHALRTTAAAVAETLAARRATAIVALLFAAASLTLCVLAVYSLLAQGVARRRRELGIRLALGATRRQLEVMVVGRSVAWTVPGLLAGVLLSIGAARLLEGLLFGVAPRDPRMFALTSAIVLLAALVAAWIPARRAGRMDALVSLRGD